MIFFLQSSSKSIFDNVKPIRGGIPFVFPKFGPWSFGPNHGFARINPWTIKGSHTSEHSVSVTLELFFNESTRAMWGYKFRLEYTVTLGVNSLKLNVSVENLDPSPFSFELLLHNYFHVDDVSKIAVSGLKGCQYVDKVILHCDACTSFMNLLKSLANLHWNLLWLLLLKVHSMNVVLEEREVIPINEHIDRLTTESLK